MKPNLKQVPGNFNEIIVSRQLESSGTMAFYNLMQLGYPTKISIDDLHHKLKPYVKPRHTSIGVNNYCMIFLLASGFLSKDFKFGKTEIHVRPGKFQLLDRMNAEFQRPNNEIKVKFNESFKKFMRRVFYIRIRFMGACTYLFLSKMYVV